MFIKGYKSFNADGTNYVGKIFIPGIQYHCDGEIKFGPHGNGYHFAKNMEDTIRYSGNDSLLRDVTIAEVIGSGEIVEGNDDYNGYYDLFAASDLQVVRYLSREEIIRIALDLPSSKIVRFVSLFKLYPTELSLFENISIEVDQALEYYQRGNKDAYRRDYEITKARQNSKIKKRI